ncbi:MAG: septum formation initiator family protein [Oscillospiraceae bacterium]|nr:septum formation initiator family protein [Oscillospiraceae bacterium]
MKVNKRKKRISLLGVYVTVAVAVLLLRALFMQPEITRNKKTIELLQSKIAYEKVRADEVETLKDKVNTDEYIERVAREKLGLVKENEKIFVDAASQ